MIASARQPFSTPASAPPRLPAVPAAPASAPVADDSRGRALGNRLGRSLFQAKLGLSRPGDARETQAQAIAAGTMRAGQRAPAGRDAGRPLPPELRDLLEDRLGGDLGGVRLHTGGGAQALTRRLGAEAFSLGGDVYFDEGRFRPETPEGMSLLSHEVAHTLQAGASRSLARQPKPGQGAAISVRDVFPFKPGARLVANQLLNSTFFGLLEKMVPDLADFLRQGQRGTVVSADDNLFEFRMDTPLTLQARDIEIPFSKDKPHVAAVNGGTVTLRLSRDADGTFDFGVFTQEPQQQAPVRMAGRAGLTAGRQEGSVVFSLGGEAFLSAKRGDAGDVRLSTREPIGTEVLGLTELPSAPAGSEQEQKAAAAVTRKIADETGPRHQRFTVGTGVQWGFAAHPLITSAWQYSFHPWLGDLFQIPVEMQIQYAPPSAVLGAFDSGAEVSLSSLQIPINLRFVGGWGAGTVPGDRTLANPNPTGKFVTGPILGVGLGLEKDWFRFSIRYDHLFNILDNKGTDVNTFHWGLGGAF